MEKAATKANRKPKLTDKAQSERFKETAREVGADESDERFGKAFRKIVPSKSPKAGQPA